MISYITVPKNSTRELPKLMNAFSKVAGQKINSKKSVALLYTDNKMAENGIIETLPFTIDKNNIKYLGDNGIMLTKQL